MTIESALADIETAGWKLNNLMYLDNGLYRASLRDNEHGYEFGQDHLPEDALRQALRHATAGTGKELLITRGGEADTIASRRMKPERKKLTLKDLGLG